MAVSEQASVPLSRGPYHFTNPITLLNDYVAAKINGVANEVTVYVTYDSTAAAGVVTVESAPDINFTGTWKSHGTLAFATTNTVHSTTLTGALCALRARVSSAVTSGTAVVDFVVSNAQVK
jgi:hypothetical protein